MSSVVVMPACNRPEMLALSLQGLSRTNNCPQDVQIYADHHANLDDIARVRDLYFPEAFLFRARPHILAISGSWNILNSIKSAARFAEDVYLVEEDVVVFPNFFHWHQTQTAPVSCGRRHWDPRWKHRDLYTNPGSLLRRPLLDALVPHINDSYIAAPREYLDRTFGPWHEVSHLDDGLIRNVMREKGWAAAYPESAVCAHIGFKNYGVLDRFKNDEKDLSKRVERLQQMLSTLSSSDPFARDFESIVPSHLF
jgi:hypothetical protein